MAALQMMKPAVMFDSKLHGHGNNGIRKGLKGKGKGVVWFKPIRRFHHHQRVCCNLQDNNGKSNSSSDEPPESLFMKELRRRGITPASLLEETNRSTVEEEIKERERDGLFSNRNTVAMGLDRSLTNQREQSMALNSEGLEGLIPRGKLLLTLGGTFFLAFWPLILITVSFFTGLYLYFGPTFIHDGSNAPVAPPPYVDPYILLQEERISR